MPWKETTAMSERITLVTHYLTGEASLASLAREAGVSYKTALKWVRRYREGGAEALANRSRRPHASPAQTPPELEHQVLAVAVEHPAWGGRKLRARLLALGVDPVPAASTITAILRRHGRLREVPVTPRAYVRFEAEAANDLWQLDFKGDQATDAGRVLPLMVLDDHSRYLLVSQVMRSHTFADIQRELTRCFREYGLPDRLLCDNGPPWGSATPHSITRFDVWLMQLDIRPIHIRPGHPQTQGKVERVHQTLKAEAFTGRTFDDLEAVQAACDAFRLVYNRERPHQALDDRTPVEHYTRSPRVFPDHLPEPHYAADATVRKVSDRGTIQYNGYVLVVGHGFPGQRVAVYETEEDGIIRIQFYNHTIRTYDLREASRGVR